MRAGEEEGEDREGGEGKRRIWSLGRRLELGADGKKSGWARRSGGRGRRGGGEDREKGRKWMEELLFKVIIPNWKICCP